MKVCDKVGSNLSRSKTIKHFGVFEFFLRSLRLALVGICSFASIYNTVFFLHLFKIRVHFSGFRGLQGWEVPLSLDEASK